MASVYLETSFVSACVTERADTLSVYRRRLSVGWWNHERQKHEVWSSPEVVRELSDPGHRGAAESNRLIDGVRLLPLTSEVFGFAHVLVREKVMPGPVAGDALHVACAACHNISIILTWNIRHLANVNKAGHLHRI